MEASTALSGSRIGNGTNPPDLTYLTYWSMVPGPEQFMEPDLVLSFLRRLCDAAGMDLKLRAEDLPEISSLRSTLVPVENFFPLDFSFVFVGTRKT